MSTPSKPKLAPVTKPAEKPTAKRKAPTAKPPAGKPETSSEVFARWKSGARISELVKEFKLQRSQIRRLLLKDAGGREAFQALRKQGAGGTTPKAKASKSQEG